MRVSLAPVVVASSLVFEALAATYNLNVSHVGADFLSDWMFQTIDDPSGGRVTYVDQATALADNLAYVDNNTLITRVDHTTVLSANGPGRNSVRIMSNAQYTTHVVVFDVIHMPQGCATWPALWEVGQDWPNNGEVDIVSAHAAPRGAWVEGVNDQSPNLMSLHVGSSCAMPSSRNETGTATSTDCNVYTDGNGGCAVQSPTNNSFGPDFNKAGGGFYVMERTDSYINVYFWSRHDTNVPWNVSSTAPFIDTSTWGTPVANFPNNTMCDLDGVVGPNNIVIDTTLCGVWAGVDSIYSGAGCPGNCVDYVNNNPGAFVDAYWEIRAVNVYT